MKKLLYLLPLLGLVKFSNAQQQIERNAKKYEALIPTQRQELLKNMDVIANMRFGFMTNIYNGDSITSKFNNDQFRLEFRGKVHERVSFRFRDRYTRSADPGDYDNLSRSTDMAFIQVELNNRSFIRAGKMCADWGGVEFDLNPIDVYEYNDILEYADNFLSGVQYTYKAGAEKKHEFTAQLLNARTQSFQTLYPSLVDSFSPSNFPAAAVLNWRGSLFNGKWQTIWSYSVFNEAQQNNMLYIALGNTFQLSEKLQVNYDFKWSDEDLDRKTIVTNMAKKLVGDNNSAYQDARYIEHWLQINYRFKPKWNINLMAFNSAAFWKNAPNKSGYTKLRDSYGFVPTLEFYPFNNLNLRFYANYVARSYVYSGYAEDNDMDSPLNNTGRFTIGLVSPLLIL